MHVFCCLFGLRPSWQLFIFNRFASQTLNGKTPYELLFGKYPNYTVLRTFGFLCFPYLRDYAPNKLSLKSSHCVFLGYTPFTRVFIVLIARHNVFISLDMSNFMKLYFLMRMMISNNFIVQHLILLFRISWNIIIMYLASMNSLISYPILNPICLPYSDDLSESFPRTSPAMSTVSSLSPPFPSVPLLTTSTNLHLMVTRRKACIFKPKAYYALTISPAS
jgi:hypothetical protein